MNNLLPLLITGFCLDDVIGFTSDKSAFLYAVSLIRSPLMVPIKP
ncbi:MAG: hypothetical protein ACTS73_08920 [Arsenophonus sp. NEOnobi-MAG3]